MKINGDFIIKEIESTGKFIVVAVGKTARKFNGMINLNSTGAFMWNCLAEGKSQEEIVEMLLNEYQVEKEVAISQTDEFIKKLKEAGLIKE